MTTTDSKKLTDRIHPAGHFGYAYPFDLFAVDGLTPAFVNVEGTAMTVIILPDNRVFETGAHMNDVAGRSPDAYRTNFRGLLDDAAGAVRAEQNGEHR